MTREKQVVEKYEVFIANDGTEFKDKEECKKYEESALGVLSAKYHPLVVGTTTEECIYNAGNGDNTIAIVKVSTDEDADLMLQMFFMFNEYYRNKFNKGDKGAVAKVEEVKRHINAAKESGEPLIVDRGYDEDDFWVFGTCSTICEDIRNNIKKAMSAE